MAPTLITSTMGASPLEAKKKHKIPIGIKYMCMAYSRPENFGDIFTYCKVNRLYGTPVSSHTEYRLGSRSF